MTGFSEESRIRLFLVSAHYIFTVRLCDEVSDRSIHAHESISYRRSTSTLLTSKDSHHAHIHSNQNVLTTMYRITKIRSCRRSQWRQQRRKEDHRSKIQKRNPDQKRSQATAHHSVKYPRSPSLAAQWKGWWLHIPDSGGFAVDQSNASRKAGKVKL